MTIQEELNAIEKQGILSELKSYKTQAQNAVTQLASLSLNAESFKTLVKDSPLFTTEEETEIIGIINTRIDEIKQSVADIAV